MGTWKILGTIRDDRNTQKFVLPFQEATVVVDTVVAAADMAEAAVDMITMDVGLIWDKVWRILTLRRRNWCTSMDAASSSVDSEMTLIFD